MYPDFQLAEKLRATAESRTGVLTFECSALGLFNGFDTHLNHLRASYTQRALSEQKSRPGFMASLLNAVGGDFGQGVGEAHAKQLSRTYWDNVVVLCGESQFQRAAADLDDKEAAILGAAAAHVISLFEKEEMQKELLDFLFTTNAQLVWAGGHSHFVDSEQAQRFPAEAAAARDLARDLMQRIIIADAASYRQHIGDLLGQFVQASQHQQYVAEQPESAAAIAAALNQGSAAWATGSDLVSPNSPFKVFEAGKDLFLGMLDTSEGAVPVGFNGNESLVTVAQPGAGKTQCHILPNLMTYDGPLVVLDPKLELLELTGGLRQSEGKKVLVLNLADDDIQTHRFNVMDFIDRRPEFMWGRLVELAEFLLPASPNDNSPIFRAKGAELLAVCLGGELLEAIAAERIPTLSRAINRVFGTPESLRNWLNDTEDRAGQYECAPLEQSAAGFAALAKNANTLEDFLRYQSNATSVLTKYRGGVIDRVANGEGDWTPEDLRSPGCTLYVRIPYEEMGIYGGFVRMVLYTIIKRLRRGGTEKGELPITFLLDEAAQLGNLDQIANVVETGRGYGMRVWMILQDYDQARDATSKPNLILKTPKVRLFMNPTLETAREVSEELGKLNQIITGKDRPLAEAAELMGEHFAQNVLLLSSGAKPMRLRKYFAWQERDYAERTAIPFESADQRLG